MAIPSITPALAQIASRTLVARLAQGVGQWLAPVAGSVLVFCVLDNLLHLPAGLRLVALAGAVALAVVGVKVRLVASARRLSVEGTAVQVEEAAQVRDNVVINACQFELLATAGGRDAPAAAFTRRTFLGGQAVLDTVPWGRLLRLRQVGLWLGLAGLALILWTGYARFFPDHAANATHRFLLPLADVPPLGAARLTVDPGKDVTVVDGEGLTVRVAVAAVDGARRPMAEAPVLIRGEGVGAIAESLDAGEQVTMAPDGKGDDGRPQPGWFLASCPNLHRSFAFRVACAGTWSRSVTVTVLPLPALRSTRFVVDGPAYSGVKAQERPGPPATLTVLPLSRVELFAVLDQPVSELRWRLGGTAVELKRRGDGWTGTTTIAAAGSYDLVAPPDGGRSERIVARGTVQLDGDQPPQVELVTADRNRFVNPDEKLALEVVASDDVGLAALAIRAREASDQGSGREVKSWRYLGPPGPAQARERFTLDIDPAHFVPGKSYIVEAVGRDFAPLPGGGTGQEGRSQPVVLRLRAINDLSLPQGDPLTGAFDLLKQAIASQTRARGVTGNVAVNLDDIRKHHTLERQAKAMSTAQEAARADGQRALEAFATARDALTCTALKPLVEGPMARLRQEAAALVEADGLTGRLEAIAAGQDDVIQRLVALLGGIAERERERPKTPAVTETAHEAERRGVKDLADDLERFVRDERRILERSKTLADGGPADLTSDEQKILGELAKEEAQWAKFLEEKLTDFSKNPPQDFSDASLGTQVNEVWQDIKAAANALDGKKIELAVPREQMGLELAENLVNNLEKWLSDAPDKIKWSQEDAPAPADVPVAELPKELEDIVGELMDKEKDMTEDVQDVTSAWMDSIDKGAGWTAADGPISNMSAKGITGNVLPNQNEVGGRSGEGRNGRSNGQMVQDEAEGKGGQETPTRLSQTPFEQGSVKDKSKDSGGGATGGGKQAGFAAEGLRGPTPPPDIKQAMARLAGKQAQIRQQAGDLALKLRAQHLPSGDLETSVQAMAAVEDAAKRFAGGAIRGRYTQALDSLGAARQAVSAESRLQRERSQLPEKLRQGLMSGTNEAIPAGYEDMVGRYFQSLAGEQGDK
jgi:hypothetical protein